MLSRGRKFQAALWIGQEGNSRRELPYYPAIPLLSIYSMKMKSVSQRDNCAPTFTALYAIAKMQKQPKCPSADE